jgi:hypothetical protein
VCPTIPHTVVGADAVNLVVVTGFFLGLAWIFFPLRIYARIYIIGNWGMDDMFLLISIVGSLGYLRLFGSSCSCLISIQILFTVYCTFGFLAVKYGVGRNVSNILPEDGSMALRGLFMCE